MFAKVGLKKSSAIMNWKAEEIEVLFPWIFSWVKGKNIRKVTNEQVKREEYLPTVLPIIHQQPPAYIPCPGAPLERASPAVIGSQGLYN